MNNFLPLITPASNKKAGIFSIPVILFFVFGFLQTYAASYTSSTSGNWSSTATWGGAGVPGSSDNVTITHGTTVTVNGAYSCFNLTIGDATSGPTTVTVSSGGSLTIKGLCSINPSNLSNTYTLNANAGSVSISGTFSWSTTGTNVVQAAAGSVTFQPAVTISASTQTIKLTGAGSVNFKSSFTDNYNKLVTFSGSTVNFYNNYTISTTAATWNGLGTAVFNGTGAITANTNLTLFNMQLAASASTSLVSASGAFIIGGALTMGSGSVFTPHESFELDGNWTNSGGTYTAGSYTVTFNGTTTLSGISSMPYVQVGNNASANAVSLQLNNNFSCTTVVFNGSTKARTLTISNSDTLTVSGDMTINQPTAAKTNNLAVNGGACIIGGNLSFIGTATSTSYTSKVTITTGLLVVNGTVSLDANTVPGNQVITLTSNGIITLNSSFTMVYGTLSSTGTGTFNFNGVAPSFTFGGSSGPILTTTNGCTVNIADGFTNNSNVLTFATTSNCYFTGNGAITANAPITFGNLFLNGTDTLTSTGNDVTIAGNCTLTSGANFDAYQSVDLTGNWINLNAGSNYIQDDGTLTVYGDFIDSGACAILPTGTLSLEGVGANISGTGSVNDSSGTFTIINDKTITSGTSLTFGSPGLSTDINLSTASTISNGGAVVVYGDISGIDSSSTWLNNVNSSLSITGELLVGGSLDASTVPNTVTYNGDGPQSIIAPISSYYNLIISNTGLKTLTGNAQADDSVSLSGSVTVDEGTYVLDGLASLSMTDTTVLEMQRSADGIYPELAGVYTLPSGTIIISETDGSAFVTPADYYNLTLTGSQPFDMSGVNYVANDLRLEESAYLDNSTTLTVGDFFTDSSSAYSTLYGDLYVYGIRLEGGTLDDGGNIITVEGAGSWSNSNGNLISTGQTVFYSGSETGTPQPITGSTPTTFNYLQINNPGDNVSLDLSPPAPTIVTGFIDLTLGNLVTDSLNILRMTDASAVVNGSAQSYVSGPMTKVGNTDFVFPTGKGGIYGQAGVSSLVTDATEVTAEYFNYSYSQITPVDTSLNQVSNREYWAIERGVTSDSLQLQLFWTNASYSSIIDCSSLSIAHFKENTMWTNEPSATIDSSDCGGTGSGSVKTNGFVTSFSPFTFGSHGGTALPITLLSFNAAPHDKAVLTNWETAMQINNNYFTVERSPDARQFTAIGTVPGAGNSTEANRYSLIDNQPLNGVSYYRLSQTDYDGHSTVSSIVAVNFNTGNTVTVYPNPAKNNVFINVVNSSVEIGVSIYNILGERVYNKTYQNEGNNPTQLISIPVTGNLPIGIYTVSVQTDGNETNSKLVVE